ncbi:unnamed protein product, partial [Ectocarpus sp. 12 AP-2014]
MTWMWSKVCKIARSIARCAFPRRSRQLDNTQRDLCTCSARVQPETGSSSVGQAEGTYFRTGTGPRASHLPRESSATRRRCKCTPMTARFQVPSTNSFDGVCRFS